MDFVGVIRVIKKRKDGAKYYLVHIGQPHLTGNCEGSGKPNRRTFCEYATA